MFRSAKIHLKHLTESQKSALKKIRYMYSELYNTCIDILKFEYNSNTIILDQKNLYLTVKNYPVFTKLKYGYNYAIDLSIQNFKTSVFKHLNFPNTVNNHTVTIKTGYIADGTVTVPATEQTEQFTITLPKQYHNRKISYVHIKETYKDYWEMIITYRKETNTCENTLTEYVGVDVGVNNLMTVACSNGNSVIIDGRSLKYILYQLYCKKNTDNMHTAKIKAKNQIEDYINKSVKFLADFLIANNVKEVLIGNSFSQSPYFKKIRYFCSDIPFIQLQQKIINKCEEHSIKSYVINECYTSKASFLDNDYMPYSITPIKYKFSGKRVKRGLYKSKNGILINADLNGAFNILNKFRVCDLSNLQNNPHLIKQPQRVKM